MREGYDLPPLMFSHDEIVALVSAARLLQAWGGTKMAAGAEEALVKIDAVLPEQVRLRSGQLNVHTFPDMLMGQQWREYLDQIEDASERNIRLQMTYVDQGATRPVVLCVLWASGFRARSGRRSAGANCAKIFACSGWTESMGWRHSTGSNRRGARP